MNFTPDHYLATNAWPFEQARRVIAQLEAKAKSGKPDKGHVLFETGYGPSGLPHIGTFGEVFRTTMVRHAFQKLMPGVATRLLAFSDDMDGLRKVPDNVPNKELLIKNLGKPLTRVPDPFEKFESFAHHNNAMLCDFLNRFGFSYEFASSTEYYTAGRFNAALQTVLEHHQAIVDIIVPTLGAERAATYSPFMPVCPQTGKVLQTTITGTNPAKGTLTYLNESGAEVETEVTNGKCKLQWKADWAMRWMALDVDYEMCGKDLIDSVTLGSAICTELGGTPPINLVYEHFVDEKGAKISKSKGNGLTIEEWLRYAPPESLSLYMYRTPTAAKKLYRGIIPQTVDEYADLLTKFPAQSPEDALENPVFHLHNGTPPASPLPCNYGMLLNLVNMLDADTPSLLAEALAKYGKTEAAALTPFTTAALQGAINYYADTVKPTQAFHTPTEAEKGILKTIHEFTEGLTESSLDAETVQTWFYDLGKQHYGEKNLRDWFKFLYTTLLGYPQGPRLGTLIAIIGPARFATRVEQALARS